ncbi:MAG: hypothetical protein IPH04_15260 [Saprospirales bacterium]|nr:hypothetical protein [Saprospirales bacterium]
MHKNTSAYVLLAAFCIAYGCQKSEIPPCGKIPLPCTSILELIPITDTCFEPLPTDPWGFLPVYPGQSDFYQYPSFDPKFFGQFLFCYDATNGSYAVKGANFCTGEIWTIHDSIGFSRSWPRLPKWSEKGWILLVRWIDAGTPFPSERGLYKIKPNGDSLTFLLNSNVVTHPIWVDNGNSILANLNGTEYNSFILNSDGTLLDTLPVLLTHSSSYESKIAARRLLPGQVDIVVFQNEEITWSYPYTEGFQNFRGLDWLNEEELVWINDNGIYRANTTTSQIDLVKEVCPNIQYSSISAARDGSNRLLLTRRDYLFENGITDSMSVRYNISLYDLDTGEEFYVKLGEM